MSVLKKISTLLCFMAIITTAAWAQSSASMSNFLSTSDLEVEEITAETLSFFTDENQRIYYIDFEDLSVLLSQIVVKDANDKVILQDYVFDLPVDTIYELDFNPFGSGEFKIELHSFTTILQQSVAIP